VVVFLVFFQVLRVGSSTESGPMVGALLVATMVAAGLAGMGACSGIFVLAMFLITSLAAVILPKV
jgi:hypothetical protein